jgi:hypothetical protein
MYIKHIQVPFPGTEGGKITVDTWLFHTCGLYGLVNLRYAPAHKMTKKEFEETVLTFISNIQDAIKDGYAHMSGNLMFSLTSASLYPAVRYDKKVRTFLQWLVSHNRTKLLHSYENNAHGPSRIFVFIHHPADVKSNIDLKLTSKPRNNTKQHLAQVKKLKGFL